MKFKVSCCVTVCPSSAVVGSKLAGWAELRQSEEPPVAASATFNFNRDACCEVLAAVSLLVHEQHATTESRTEKTGNQYLQG